MPAIRGMTEEDNPSEEAESRIKRSILLWLNLGLPPGKCREHPDRTSEKTGKHN